MRPRRNRTLANAKIQRLWLDYSPMEFVTDLVLQNAQGDQYFFRSYIRMTFRHFRRLGAWMKLPVPGTRWVSYGTGDRLTTVDPGACLRWARKVGLINEEQFQAMAARLTAEMMGC